MEDRKEVVYKMEEEKIFNKNYILLMIINTLLFTSFNMINPVLPKYVTGLGMSVTLAGVLSGCFSITALIFRPLSGIAADKMSQKRLYLAAGAIITAACCGYAVFSSFSGLFFVRVVHGIFFAVDTTVSLVLVTRYIPKGKMGQGIGFFGIGPIIAIAFAPGMGLKIGTTYGYINSFFIAAVMSAAATLLILFVANQEQRETPDAESEKIQESKALPQPAGRRLSLKQFIATEVIVFAFLAGLFSFANSIEYTFIALYSETKGIDDISIYFTVSAAFILLSRLFAGRIYDKKGLAVILYPAYLVGAVSMFILGNAGCMAMFLAAAALKALGQGAGQPSLQSQCMTSVSQDRVGVASSTYYLGPDIMQGIGPIVGGAVIDRAGYAAAYDLCGILMLAGIVFYAGYMRYKKGKAAMQA